MPGPFGGGAIIGGGAIEIPLSFAAQEFTFYGQTKTSLFASVNGLISFGTFSFSPAAQLSDFWSGQPKIAAFWNELEFGPYSQMRWARGVDSEDYEFVRVTYERFQRFSSEDENTFEVTLYEDGVISLHWVDIDSGGVGISPGGWLGYPFVNNLTANLVSAQEGVVPFFGQYSPLPSLPGIIENPIEGARVTFVPDGDGYIWYR